MQNITRAKSRPGQPPGRVALPGKDLKNFPKRLNGNWQGKTVVIGSSDVGSSSISESIANGVH